MKCFLVVFVFCVLLKVDYLFEIYFVGVGILFLWMCWPDGLFICYRLIVVFVEHAGPETIRHQGSHRAVIFLEICIVAARPPRD